MKNRALCEKQLSPRIGKPAFSVVGNAGPKEANLPALGSFQGASYTVQEQRRKTTLGACPALMRTQVHNSLRKNEQEQERIQADKDQIKMSPYPAAYTAARCVRSWTCKQCSA